MLRILQAHGLDAGPTQRPLLTGLLTGALADLPAAAVLAAFGSLSALSKATGASPLIVAFAHLSIVAVSGLLYGWLFGRAANDRRGGWLFGMAFGFIFWMLGLVPLLQWLPGEPIMTGASAIGLLLGHLLWGLALGSAFPFLHRPFQAGVRAQTGHAGPEAAIDARLLRNPRRA